LKIFIKTARKRVQTINIYPACVFISLFKKVCLSRRKYYLHDIRPAVFRRTNILFAYVIFKKLYHNYIENVTLNKIFKKQDSSNPRNKKKMGPYLGRHGFGLPKSRVCLSPISKYTKSA
jgi:hypothetical protein